MPVIVEAWLAWVSTGAMDGRRLPVVPRLGPIAPMGCGPHDEDAYLIHTPQWACWFKMRPAAWAASMMSISTI